MFVFRGKVNAQFSHAIARFLSFSSYVLRKLLSRRPCSAATRGLSGGVSRAGADALPGCPDSEDVEFCRPALRMPSNEREDVLGLRESWPSKQDEQPTGRASVTIKGVGPWVSQ